MYVARQTLDPEGRWTAFFIDAVWGPVEESKAGHGRVGWPFLEPRRFDFTSEVSLRRAA